MMRRECLKLAQQAALALCTNNDPTEYFNALSNTLDCIEGDKPMWTAVYEAYLSLHGVGNQTQDVAHARMLINKALKAYNTPVCLEQLEMLILAVVLADYRKNYALTLKLPFVFFNLREATELESLGITILDKITEFPYDHTCAYLAHKKLQEIYSEPIFNIIRNAELVNYHSGCAQNYATTILELLSGGYSYFDIGRGATMP